MIEGIQQETRSAVSFMESGVQDVDRSLKKTEQSSAENANLHSLVEHMFLAIKQLNENSKRHEEAAQRVGVSAQQMNGSISTLQERSSSVKNTAHKLNQLVSVFQVSVHWYLCV